MKLLKDLIIYFVYFFIFAQFGLNIILKASI